MIRNLDTQPESAGLRLIFHVPDLGAGIHQGMDTVAGVAWRSAGINQIHPVEIPLHL